MLNFDRFLRNVLTDLRVELGEEFDRNFERKAFFTEAWLALKREPGRGSLMMHTGALRNSIAAQISGTSIVFSSSLPYAGIHNEGGELKVTPRMKKFFWAMYYQTSGAITKKKSGEVSNSKKNQALTADAAKWKALALMKVGDKIKIPERRFIGWHDAVNKCVRDVIDANAQELIEELKADLQRLSTRFK